MQNSVDPGNTDSYSIRYKGFIEILSGDKYNFVLTSDDGAGLYINDVLVVDNDGFRATTTKRGSIYLSPGIYPIEIDYFDVSGGELLTLRYSTSSLGERDVPFSMLSSVSCMDKDLDGLFNAFDLDSDGDGCPDATEGSGSITNAELEVSAIDGGNTGPDYLGFAGPVVRNLGNIVNTNSGSGAYGVPTIVGSGQGYGTGREMSGDVDGDSIGDTCDCYDNSLPDTDGDGVPDYIDVDSDNDGIFDYLEGDDSVDTDGDGVPDYLDLDSDNDGISDLVEALGDYSLEICEYEDGNVINRITLCETGESVGGEITPNNTDFIMNMNPDDLPDYIDLDSDGDTCPDGLEGRYDPSLVNTADYLTVSPADVDAKGVIASLGCLSPTTDDWTNQDVNDACCEIDESTLALSLIAPSTCSPANDGSIIISGGNLKANTEYAIAYTYESAAIAPFVISTGEDGSLTITGLSPGEYTAINITSEEYPSICMGTVPGSPFLLPVFENTLLLQNDDIANVQCFDGADGGIYISISGGTGTYQYDWTTADGSGIQPGIEDQTQLTAGTYNVTVTDLATLCVISLNNIVVTEPAEPLSGAGEPVDIVCFGDSSGSITLTPSGGTAPYTYQWSTVDGVINPDQLTDKDLTDLPLGTYSVVITDANGCTNPEELLWELTSPSAPVSGTYVQTDVLCFGAATGAINLSPAGGAGPAYSYLWTTTDGIIPAGQETQQDLSGLVSGTYELVISDASGCTNPDPIAVIITQPAAAVTVTGAGTDILCFGGATGSITASPVGGTAPYAYLWTTSDGNIPSGQAIVEDPSGLTAGTYTLRITDANGCVYDAALTISLSQPAASVAGSTSQVDILCNAHDTGSISLIPDGGVAPYTFLWTTSNGNIPSGQEIVQDPTGLTAGTYIVTITDQNGCTNPVPVEVTLTEPTEIVLKETLLSHKNVTCDDPNSGGFVVVASGGVGPYTYSIDDFASSNTTGDFAELPSGTYNVQAQDAKGCVIPGALRVVISSFCIDVVNSQAVEDTDGDGTTNPGDRVNYTITITNSGEQPITGIALAETFSDALGRALTMDSGPAFSQSSEASPQGTLASGESAIYLAEFTLTQAVVNAGGLISQVKGTATGNDGIPVEDVSDNGIDDDGNTSDDPTLLNIPESPLLVLVKSAAVTDNDNSLSTTAGDKITYSFTLTNEGNVTITGLKATDTLQDVEGKALNLSSPFTFVSSSTGNNNATDIGPSEVKTYTASYLLTQADIDAGGVSNTALIEGLTAQGTDVSDRSDEGNPDNGADDPTETLITKAAEVTLVKIASTIEDVDFSSDNNVGDRLTYTFTIRNTGNVTISNLVLTDDFLPDGTDLSLFETSLLPGKGTSLMVDYTLVQEDVNIASITNSATITGTDPDGLTLSDISDDGKTGDGDTGDDPTVVDLQTNAILSFHKIATFNDANGDGLPQAGETITYKFSVRNTGHMTINSITIDDSELGFTGEALSPSSLDPNQNGSIPNRIYTLSQADIDQGEVSNTATATGDRADGDGTVSDISDDGVSSNGVDTPTLTVLTQLAQYDLVKTGVYEDTNGDNVVNAGDRIIYDFEITNSGNVTLDNTTLTDAKLSLTDAAVYTAYDNITEVSSLAPEAKAYSQVPYTISQADMDAGKVVNSAQVNGTDPNAIVVTQTSDNGLGTGATVVNLAKAPSLELEKTALVNDGNANGRVDAGEIITYTFDLTNTGNVTIKTLTVTDPRIGMSNKGTVPASLAPGASAVVSGEYAITQGDIDAGKITNSATARGLDPFGFEVLDLSDDGSEIGNQNTPTVTLLTNEPSMKAVKVQTVEDTNGDNLTGGIGDLVSYSISLSNTGNTSLSGISLVDDFRDALGVSMTLDAGPTFDAALSDNIKGTLLPGQIAVYNASFVIVQPVVDAGGLSNSVTFSATSPTGLITDLSDDGDDEDGNSTDDPTELAIPESPELTVLKTAKINDLNLSGATDANDRVDYTITVSNTGTVSLSAITLVDVLTDRNGEGLSLSTDPTFRNADQGSAEGQLAPGETATYDATYILTQADMDAQGLINTLTASAQSPAGTPVSDISDDGDTGTGDTGDDPTVTIIPKTPQLTLIKTASGPEDLDGSGDNNIGDAITYTFHIINTGNVTISNLVLTDSFLPAGTDLTVSPAVLAPAETVDVTVTYILTQADIDAGFVQNSALISGQDPDAVGISDVSDDGDEGDSDLDPDSLGDNDPTYVDLSTEASLNFFKTALFNDENGNGFPDAGETISYSFSVKNTGNITIDNLSYDDQNLAITDAPISPSKIGPGQTGTGAQVDYTLSQADIDLATVSNQATVQGNRLDGEGEVFDLSDDGNPANGGNNPTKSSLAQNIKLSLQKTGEYVDTNGDGVVNVGDEINYTFTTVNIGNTTLANITLIDDRVGVITPGRSMVPDILAPTETATLSITYPVTLQDMNDGKVINQATVSGSTESTAINQSFLSNESTVLLPKAPSVALVKTAVVVDANGNNRDDVGDEVDYTFRLENTGNVTLSSLKVSDEKLGVENLAFSPSSIDPGQVAMAYATYDLSQTDMDNGQVLNEALASAKDPQGITLTQRSDNGEGTGATITPLSPDPVIEVVKVQSAADTNEDGVKGGVNDLITYAVLVKNTGNVTLNSIVLEDLLVDEMDRPLGLTSGLDYIVANRGSAEGTLKPGESAAYSATYMLSQADVDAGGLSNQITATANSPAGVEISDLSDDGDISNGADNPTVWEIPEAAGLELIKLAVLADSDNSQTDNEGDQITFTITATNTGNVTLTGLALIDDITDLDNNILSLDAPLAFLSASMGSAEGTLKPNESATYQAVYTATQSDINVGGIINSATGNALTLQGTNLSDISDEGDPLNGEDTPTQVDFAQSPAMELIKTSRIIDINNNMTNDEGDEIAYTFRIQNIGNVTVDNLELVDTKLPSPILLSQSTLQPGEIEEVIVNYTLTLEDINSGKVSNRARVNATDPDAMPITDVSDDGNDADTDGDGDPGNDPTITLLPSVPELALDKTFILNDENANGRPDAGETITYQFTVTNVGYVTISDLTIDDEKLAIAGLEVSPAILDPGQVGTISDQTYILSQNDIDLAIVANDALVNGLDNESNPVSDISDNGDAGDGSDDPTLTELAKDAQISLDKTGVYADDNGDGVVNAGDVINYSFTVLNTGNVTIKGLKLKDDFLPLGTDLTLSPISIGPGLTATATVEYRLNQDDIDAGTVINIATAEGTDPDMVKVTASDNNQVDLPKSPELELIKTAEWIDANSSGREDVGDNITYSFVVTNIDNVTISALTLEDARLKVSNKGFFPQIIGPGESATTSYTYTLLQQDLDDGEVVNSATATGHDPDGEDVSDLSDFGAGDGSSPTEQPLAQLPSLEVVKKQVFQDVNFDGLTGIGDQVNYTMTIHNTGNVTISTLTLTDTFLDANSLPLTLSSEPTYMAAGSDNVEGILAPGQKALYTASFIINQQAVDAGGLSNSLLVEGVDPTGAAVSDVSDDGDDTDGNTEDDVTEMTIEEFPSVEVTKMQSISDDDADAAYSAGDIISYEIEVTNTGNVTLSAITLEDVFSRKDGQLLSLDAGPDFDAAQSDNTEGLLAPGQVAIYEASYALLQSDVDFGGLTNTVTVSSLSPAGTSTTDISDDGDDLDGNRVDDPTELLIQEHASLIAQKILDSVEDVDANGEDNVGDIVHYTITVTNTGNVTLANLQLVDELLDARGKVLSLTNGPAFVSSSDGSPEGELQLDETASYTASYTLSQLDVDAGGVSNAVTATATSSQGTQIMDVSDDGISDDGNTRNDRTDLFIEERPEIEVVKPSPVINQNDGNSTLDAGDELVYTITVQNTGNVTLRNIVLSDELHNYLDEIIEIESPSYSGTDGSSLEGKLLPLETATYTLAYTLTQQDIDAGGVYNSASVISLSPNNIETLDISDDADDTDGNVVDDVTESIIPPLPAITLVKEGVFMDENGDGCTDVGESITYTLTASNEGNVSLHQVMLSDPLITDAQLLLISGDENRNSILDVSEVWTYEGVYLLTQENIDEGLVTNQASITATAPDATEVTDLSGTAGDNDEPTQLSLCQQSALTMVKQAVFEDENADGCVQPEETVTYTFIINNTGNVSLTNLEILDPLLPEGTILLDQGDLNADGVLDVTESWTYKATYTISQEDIDAGVIVNQATATATDPMGGAPTDMSGTAEDNDQPTSLALCQQAAVALMKTAQFMDENADGCADSDESILYQFEVHNLGNVSLRGLDLTDPKLAAGQIQYIDGDVDGDSELDVTEIWTYEGSYILSQVDIDQGAVENQATIVSSAPSGATIRDLSGLSAEDDDPTVLTLCQQPAISLIKTSLLLDENGDECANAGETVQYNFTLANEGNVSLEVSEITDPLLLDETIVLIDGDINFDGILDVNETWIYKADYRIPQTDIDLGLINNQASASAITAGGLSVSDLSGSSADNDEVTTTTLCQQSGIVLVKTAAFIDENEDGCADPGESITYGLVLTNSGNVSLSNILLNDPLLGDDGLVFGGGDTDNDNQLDVTETWVYSGVYILGTDDLDLGSVNNQAEVSAVGPDGITISDISGTDADNDEGTLIELCQEFGIGLIKRAQLIDSDEDGCSDAGETIQYDFEIYNLGNTSISEVQLSDPMLGEGLIEYVSGDEDGDTRLDVGEIWAYTALYTLSQAEVDTGELTNQASVTGLDPNGEPLSDLSGSALDNDTATVLGLCQVGEMTLVKTVVTDDDSEDCALAGQLVTFRFELRNTGNVSLLNISLTDTIPTVSLPALESGDTDGDQQLDVGEMWIYSATYTLTQADVDQGIVENYATAIAASPLGERVKDLSGTSEDNDEPTAVIICESPSMALVKTGVSMDENGNGCADENETIQYTFELSNTGNVSLAEIRLEDSLLDGATITLMGGDTDGDGQLDVDEIWNYQAQYTITQADIDLGQVSNQALANALSPTAVPLEVLSGTAVGNEEVTITSICQNSVIVLIQEPDSNLRLAADGCMRAGDPITYNYIVINEGNVTLREVSISDPLVPMDALNYESGDINMNELLDVGEEWIYSGQYNVTQEDINAGYVSNQSMVQATDPAGDILQDLSGTRDANDEPTVVDICQAPNIALSKTGIFIDANANGFADLDELIQYTFTVENNGNMALSNIMVTDPKVTVMGRPITNLMPGQIDEASFTASYIITEEDILAGVVINSATAEGTTLNGQMITDVSDDPNDPTNRDDDADGDGEDHTSTALPVPAVVGKISFSMEGVWVDNDEDGYADVGETIQYSFVIDNTGNVTLHGVYIDAGDIEIIGDRLNRLLPRQADSGSFIGFYTLTEADLKAGSVTRSALAVGDNPRGVQVSDISDDPTNATDDDLNEDGDPDDPTVTEFPVRNVDLQVQKSSAGQEIYEGNLFTYQLNLFNNSDAEAFNVIFTDTLPDNVAYHSVIMHSDNEGIQTNINGQIISWTVPQLAGGGEIALSLTVKALDPGTVINSAVGSSDGEDAIPSDNKATDINIIKAFRVPNVITPNEDGENDAFEVLGLGKFDKNELVIFNRYGDHVFQSEDYQNDWSAKGQVSGTYYYILKAWDASGDLHEFKGWIQVIKD